MTVVTVLFCPLKIEATFTQSCIYSNFKCQKIDKQKYFQAKENSESIDVQYKAEVLMKRRKIAAIIYRIIQLVLAANIVDCQLTKNRTFFCAMYTMVSRWIKSK